MVNSLRLRDRSQVPKNSKPPISFPHRAGPRPGWASNTGCSQAGKHPPNRKSARKMRREPSPIAPGTVPMSLKVCANILRMRKQEFKEDDVVSVVQPGWRYGPPLWTSLLFHGLRELLHCLTKPSRILHCSR